MPAKIIELPEIGTVRFLKRHGSHSLRLSFDDKGIIKVSMPFYVPYNTAMRFVLERKDWIEKHRPSEHQPLKSGARIGKAHRLTLIPSQVKTAQVRVNGSFITVKYPNTFHYTNPAVQAAAERGSKKVLQSEAETLLPQRLTTLAQTYGFRFRSVTVKQLKTKWGSCNQNHEITLNYYLMQLPWQLIDYVLLHELVHTEHLDHSAAFWQRFESVLPGAKKLRKELRSYKTAVSSL